MPEAQAARAERLWAEGPAAGRELDAAAAGGFGHARVRGVALVVGEACARARARKVRKRLCARPQSLMSRSRALARTKLVRTRPQRRLGRLREYLLGGTSSDCRLLCRKSRH